MRQVEEADAAMAEGRDDDAAQGYIEALDQPRLTLDDRAHVMCQLTSLYAATGQWDDAESAAREAVSVAGELGTPEAEARAQLALGAVLEMMCREEIPAAAQRDGVFREAMAAFERAASLYQGLGHIEHYGALVSMADAMAPVDAAAAKPIFERVVHDLTDAKWAGPDTAGQADRLRGEAFYGLADLALTADDQAAGRAHLDSAAKLLIASGAGDPNAADLLHEIADLFEDPLNDLGRASELRTAADVLLA